MHTHYPDHIIDSAVADYVAGDSSRVISNRYGMHYSSVCRMIKRMGEQTRTASESKRVYSIDETFFAKIDSHEKAQILGFIYADGCLIVKTADSGLLQIVLNPTDRDYLEWIRQQMKSNRSIHETDYTHGGKRKHSVWLVTSQPEIIRDLQALGVTPRKSLTIGFPTERQVPEQFIWSFVRGVFEGDGCFHLGRCRKGPTLKPDISIISSVPFTEGLERLLTRSGIAFKTNIRATTDGTSSYAILRINTVADSIRFGDLIYANASYCMDRKKQKWEQFKAQYRETPEGYELIQ